MIFNSDGSAEGIVELPDTIAPETIFQAKDILFPSDIKYSTLNSTFNWKVPDLPDVTVSMTTEEVIEKLKNIPIQLETSKEKILRDLGFQPRESKGRWYNPIFGSDSEENWIWFDLETDQISSIVPKLFRAGYVQGERKVRWDIKKALDITLA
jgi:hypothetical protein